MNKDAQYSQLSDEALLEQYQKFQNNEMLGFLLQRYTLLLLGVCIKYLKNEEEAKDAVQQVFSKVITEVKKYPVGHFKSWLYTITRNHCFMLLRNKMRPLPEEAIEQSNKGYWADTDDQIGEVYEKEKLITILEESLQKIPASQRLTLTLFFFENKSYREIAEYTGLTLLHIKSFIQNGKRNLRQMIVKKMKENA